jgi:hypothetical protein
MMNSVEPLALLSQWITQGYKDVMTLFQKQILGSAEWTGKVNVYGGKCEMIVAYFIVLSQNGTLK